MREDLINKYTSSSHMLLSVSIGKIKAYINLTMLKILFTTLLFFWKRLIQEDLIDIEIEWDASPLLCCAAMKFQFY